MTEDKSILNDRTMDDLFAQARQEQAEPSPEFMARLLADIDMVHAEQHLAVPTTPKDGFLRGLWDTLGGWAGSGSLAAAAVAGLWVGIAQPTGLQSVTDTFWSETETVSVFATSLDIWDEG